MLKLNSNLECAVTKLLIEGDMIRHFVLSYLAQFILKIILLFVGEFNIFLFLVELVSFLLIVDIAFVEQRTGYDTNGRLISRANAQCP